MISVISSFGRAPQHVRRRARLRLQRRLGREPARSKEFVSARARRARARCDAGLAALGHRLRATPAPAAARMQDFDVYAAGAELHVVAASLAIENTPVLEAMRHVATNVPGVLRARISSTSRLRSGWPSIAVIGKMSRSS